MLHHNANHASRSLRRSVLAATALSLPMIAGVAQASPLSMPAPLTFSAGPLGKLDVQGIASGMAFYQDNSPAISGLGGKNIGADISNGMVIVQKNTGQLQFYIQAGAYNFPTVGVPFVSTGSSVNSEFGALPVAYLKYAPTANFSMEIGKLPTLIGAESGFTYQNINIQRGLLWNVEPIVSRGIQFNYSAGPVSASVSWNDGYYSNRFNWVTGLVSYAIDSSNTVSVYAGGNVGNSAGYSPNSYSNANIVDGADDSDIYGLMYEYSSGPWMIEPYVQYMYTPAHPLLGINTSSANYGASVLADYSFTNTVSLGGRVEYLAADNGGASGGGAAGSVTGFGPGSHAWSFTLTPTYQDGGFFARADLSYVNASEPYGWVGSIGTSGTNTTQLRGMLETGFMF